MSTWKGLELALDFCGRPPWSDAWSGGRECDEPDYSSIVVTRLIILVLWNLSYGAMFDLAKVLYNPFANRRLDVAHEFIQAGLRKLADQLLNDKFERLPPAMLPEQSGFENIEAEMSV